MERYNEERVIVTNTLADLYIMVTYIWPALGSDIHWRLDELSVTVKEMSESFAKLPQATKEEIKKQRARVLKVSKLRFVRSLAG